MTNVLNLDDIINRMAKRVLFVILLFFCLICLPGKASAVENPLNTPNNKIGIHILFDSELRQAAELVNSNGGDWGYVTIPIQAGDKDLVKWQKFMDSAKNYHLIPVMRLATEGDYFNTKVWRKPKPEDIIDFANFLDSLKWPTKNRYIIIFNEVNRADEWGGTASPQEYSELLSFAVTVFKSKNPDYFIISSGLDNAAPNQGTVYINQYDYMRQMDSHVPNIFSQVDGIASHSYPNPAFSQPPTLSGIIGTGSFFYERQLARSLSKKELPVFIVETGWSSEAVSEDVIASYYMTAMNTVWNDPSVVAITPFLLQGWGGPFQKFSFIGENGYLTKQYRIIHDMPKIHGMPQLQTKVLAAETIRNVQRLSSPQRDFSRLSETHRKFSLSLALQSAFRWLLRI